MYLKTILLFPLLFLVQLCAGQNLEAFVRGSGVRVMAGLAHPTNEFIGGEYAISADGTLVTMTAYTKDSFWGNRVTTTVTFRRSGYLFTALRVDSDNDSVDPFIAVSILKAALNEEIRSSFATEERGIVAALERQLGKTITEMDGIDISLALMSLAFYAY